jgi:hypothetical protein
MKLAIDRKRYYQGVTQLQRTALSDMKALMGLFSSSPRQRTLEFLHRRQRNIRSIFLTILVPWSSVSSNNTFEM